MGHGLHNLSSAVLSVFPSARDELRQLYESVDADDYISAAIFSSTVVGATFALFLTIISISRGFNPLMLGFGALLGMCMFAFYIIYPGILVRKIAQKTDNELVFALRELSLQIESGVALYDAMANIASGNYGYASRAFATAVREISSGVPEKKALQKMAVKSQSEFLKRIVWQVVTATESGASVAFALRSVVERLMDERFRLIKEYAGKLNFLILIFMLIAAAIPSIGMTFLIILSTFSGYGLTKEVFLMVIAGSFLGQIMLIGYINSSRPVV